MNGYTNIEGHTVIYSYEDGVLTFLLDTIHNIKQSTINSEGMALPTDEPYIIGYDFNTHNYYVFFVSYIPDLHLEETPLLATTVTTSVYGYIKYDASYKSSAISGMSFYGQEIDKFYSLKKGYKIELPLDLRSGIVRSIPYEETTDSFEFSMDGEKVTCTLGVLGKANLCDTNPLSFNSRVLLQFEETNSSEKIINLFEAVKTFFSFITYRKNIDISNVRLYGKTEYSSFSEIGMLYYQAGKCDIEDKEEIGKTIPYEFIKDHISDIFELIVNDKLYVRHIPESSYSRRQITAARFVLTTAAFEWTVRSAYIIPKSTKQEQVKKDILEAIEEIPTSKGYNKDLKDKFKFFQKIISGMDTNLSGKIVYALNDLDSILEPFIKKLYQSNKKEVDSYPHMGDRLQKQRNNYAHGNIDKELNPDVILDILVLEWVNHSMVFKMIGYTDMQIAKLINGIFHLNCYIPDDEE